MVKSNFSSEVRSISGKVVLFVPRFLASTRCMLNIFYSYFWVYLNLSVEHSLPYKTYRSYWVLSTWKTRRTSRRRFECLLKRLRHLLRFRPRFSMRFVESRKLHSIIASVSLVLARLSDWSIRSSTLQAQGITQGQSIFQPKSTFLHQIDNKPSSMHEANPGGGTSTPTLNKERHRRLSSSAQQMPGRLMYSSATGRSEPIEIYAKLLVFVSFFFFFFVLLLCRD